MKLIINIKGLYNINYMNAHIYTKEIKFSWKNVLRMNKMINILNLDIDKKPYIMSI